MRILPRRLIMSAAFFALAALAGALSLSSAPPASAATTTVQVGDLWFCSSSFENGSCTTTINAGDTVVWDFAGAVNTHTSTSDTDVWDSGVVQPGGSFQYTFPSAGSFPYHCEVHPQEMRGVIVVQAAAASPTSTLVTSGTFPLATVRPTSTPSDGALPVAGQGPDSGSTSWWLVGALALAGVTLGGLSLVFARRRA